MSRIALTLALLIPGLAAAHDGRHDCAPATTPILSVAGAFAVDEPTLLYFGFTTCPDVCPIDVSRNHEAVAIAAEAGHAAANLFVTVDPADSQASVDRYVSNWPGTGGRVADPALRAALRVVATPREGAPGLWDHSTLTYLVAPGVGVVQLLPRDLSPEAVAEALACQG
jgi:protein SCO1